MYRCIKREPGPVITTGFCPAVGAGVLFDVPGQEPGGGEMAASSA